METLADSIWMIVPKCDLSVCPTVKELNNQFEISGNHGMLKRKKQDPSNLNLYCWDQLKSWMWNDGMVEVLCPNELRRQDLHCFL